MGSGGSQTQTTTATPWQPQGEQLSHLFNLARANLNAPPELYGGSQVAAQTPDQLQAQQLLREQVPGLQQQATSAQTSNQQLLGASDVGNNQIVSDAIQSALNPLARQFTDIVLPSLKIGATDAGNSSRQGVLEANATRDFGETSANLVGSLMGNFYGQGLDAQAKGLSLAPGIGNFGNAAASNLANVGDTNQAYQQAVLGDEVSRFNAAQNAPLVNLMNFRNLLTGGFGGTTTGPTGTQNPSGLGGLIGGGLSGYAATGNPFGAGLGALASFL